MSKRNLFEELYQCLEEASVAHEAQDEGLGED